MLYKHFALEVSAAVGMSESTGFKGLTEMLDTADKLMLEDKKQHNPR